MEQVYNKLSLIYNVNDDNQLISLSFDINAKKLNITCSCTKYCYCTHTDFIVDYIYNSYFHYDEIDHDDVVLIWASDNKLWLPVQETDTFDNSIFINIELMYICNKFHYYCSFCEPGLHTVENCRHLDYIIKKFSEHYYELKEENEDINNISFCQLNLTHNFENENSNMEIEN